MVAVRLYIEGGGDDNYTKSRLRAGFAKYFGKLLGDCNKPSVIICGGRKKLCRADQLKPTAPAAAPTPEKPVTAAPSRTAKPQRRG